MRHAALSFLVVSSMLLSGCVDFFTPTPEEIEEAEHADQADDAALDDANDPTPGTGDTGDDPEPKGSDPEPDPAANESEEPEESLVVPPLEQLVDHVDDVDRPGEYAFLPKASAQSSVTTEVPEWPTGATWRYQSNFGTYNCESTHKVVGSDEHFDVPVYKLDIKNGDDCQSRPGETTTELRWKDNLLEIDDEGYVEHTLAFPLEDGLKWRYHRYASSPDAHPTTDAEVDYKAQYLWNTNMVAAWHITLTYPEANGSQLVIEKWYGIEARNILREEYKLNGAPLGSLDLVSYDL